jgi:hypothetical protein
MKGRDSFAEDSEVGDQGGRHPRAVSPLASDRARSNTCEKQSDKPAAGRASSRGSMAKRSQELVLAHFLPFFFFLPPPLPPVVVGGAAGFVSGAGASFSSAPPSAAGASSIATSSGAA